MKQVVWVCFVLCAWANSAWAACAKPTTIVQLLNEGVEGERAFAASDVKALYAHSTRAREIILPCLGEKVTPKDAAAFHRLMAFEAFTHKAMERVVAEFHAARKIEPGYDFPLEVVPEEHRLRHYYDQALLAPDGELKPVFPPDGGYVTVGGVRNAPRPEKTPVIIQALDPLNRVLETRYLQPGETLPAWGKNPFGLTAKDLGIEQTSAWVQPKTWYIASGIGAMVTAGLYGVARYNKSQFQTVGGQDSADSDRALQDYADRANGFGTASVVTGALAAGFLGTAFGFQLFGQTAREEKP